MSHWNYRVMEKVYAADEHMHSIHEVYYDDDGNVTGWTEAPVGIIANVAMDESLETQLERFRTALEKPVLDYETGKEI